MIKITEFKEGQLLDSICYPGHNWEIAHIFDSESIWGVCQNDDCTVEENTQYWGVSPLHVEDLEDRILQLA